MLNSLSGRFLIGVDALADCDEEHAVELEDLLQPAHLLDDNFDFTPVRVVLIHLFEQPSSKAAG